MIERMAVVSAGAGLSQNWRGDLKESAGVGKILTGLIATGEGLAIAPMME